MKKIHYYAVSFGKETKISTIMVDKNFEDEHAAVKYMNSVLDRVKDYCQEGLNDEEVISDHERAVTIGNCTYYSRQLVSQNQRGFCRIYSGQVDPKNFFLN